ncbi:MAG: glycosyltransferase family 4 protein [Kiloniellales bacterium]
MSAATPRPPRTPLGAPLRPPLAGRCAVLLKGYPRLSESFIAQEILALERRGLELRLYSLRRPTDPAVHPAHREIAAPVSYLPEYLHREPRRVLAGWRRARRLPGYVRAWRAWLRDLRRDPSPNRLRRFGQACVLAAELPPEIAHIHAHFLHTPASVARYAAVMRGLAWSASAHAKDIWTTPPWELREKLAEAAWVVTCTAVGRDYLQGLSPRPGKVALVYHGLDLARFPPPGPGEMQCNGGDGRDPAAPLVILSVGRAVAKKGYGDLLEALAKLPPGLAWRFVHIGGGPLLPQLKARADHLGLAGRIDWLGAQAQEAVLARYRAADLFVLASRIAKDGDRDGLPNVLLEAQSQALPCLATRVSAIPELIEDEVTGLLVPPGDPAVLAAALTRLIGDPTLRARLGTAGAERMRRDFALDGGIDALAARFGLEPRARAAE